MSDTSHGARRTLSFALFCSCLVFVCLAVFIAAVGPVVFFSRHLGPIEDFVEEKLHRTLTVGSISGTLWPELAVQIDGVALSGVDGKGEPMLLLPDVRVRFDSKEAARTFGRHIVINEVVITGGVLRAERDHEGNVDLLEILKLLPPIPPEVAERGELKKLRIEGGRIEFHDAADADSAVVVTITDVTGGFVDGRAGAPADAALTGRWREADGAFSLHAHMDEVPRNLRPVPTPKTEIQLLVDDGDLALGLESLGLPPVFHSGVADLAADIAVDEGGVAVDLHVDAVDVAAFDRVAVAHVGEDAQLRWRFHVDAADGFTVVDDLHFAGAGIAIDGAWRARQPIADDIDTLQLAIAVDDLQRVRRRIPVLRDVTPGALFVQGPANARFDVDPGSVVADADLDGAFVSFGEALAKPKGAPLSLRIDVVRAGAGSDANVGALVAHAPGGVVIDGNFSVDDHRSAFDLRLQRTQLQRLLDLSPLLKELLDGDVRGGSVSADIRVAVNDDDGAVKVHLDGRDVDLVLPDAGHGKGSALVDVGVVSKASGLAIDARVDLDDVAGSIVNGGRTWFHKPRGAPLVVEAKLREVGGGGALAGALGSLDQDSAVSDVVGSTALAPRWRTIATRLAGEGALRADDLVVAGVEVDDVVLMLQLADGRFSVARPSGLKAFGGALDVAGSFVDVKDDPAVIGVDAAIDGVQIGGALSTWREAIGSVTGTGDVVVDVAARGLSLTSWRRSLNGSITVATHALRVDRLQGLVDVGGSADDKIHVLELGKERLRLKAPLVVVTAVGPVVFTGGAAFDGSVDVDAVLNGHGALPLAVHIGGTAQKPALSWPQQRKSWSTSKSKVATP